MASRELPGGQIVLVDFRRTPGVTDEWVINHVRAGERTFVGEITAAGFQLVNDHVRASRLLSTA